MNTPPRKPPRPVPPRSSSARPGGSARPLPTSDDAAPPVIPPRRSVRGQPAPHQPPAQHPDQPLPRSGMGAINRTQLMPQGQPPAGAPPAGAPPVGPPAPYHQPAGPRPPRRRRGRAGKVLLLLLALLLAWPIGLLVWANGKLNHVDALSEAAGGDYTTYLLAGSDSRADGFFENDTTAGHRTDTIMLLTVPASGTTSLISIPRDTYVAIPGHNPNKINSAYSRGGAPLLVATVEQFTGMKVDHYIEIGMGGVASVVDAVGGVELCADLDVDDSKSGLTWTPGCHLADGETALAFSRMRYQDPKGDIGRTERQQQVIKAVTKAALSPEMINPARQVTLLGAGVGSLAVDEDSNIIDLGRLAWAFRAATGDNGVRGTPPISSLNYQPGGVGSAVLITDEDAARFFAAVADGTVSEEDTGE